MKHHKAIIINGASSSGTTSLVLAFSQHYPEYTPVYIDSFIDTLSKDMWLRCASTDEGWAEIGIAFNTHISKLVNEGKTVIADTFYQLPVVQEHLCNTLGRKNVFLVQLFCELEELEQRELIRGNRRIGLARGQFTRVYSLETYDLQIDSTHQSTDECSKILHHHLST